jgi:hypothetical protein
MISDFVKVKDSGSLLKFLVVFLLVLLINTLIVRFLWNNVLVKYIKILSPVQSLLDTLLLAIAMTMFSGSCVCQ